MSSLSLSASYEAARSIMEARAESFYQAFQLLPKKRFEGICAIYAFCRYADDIGDGLLPEDQKRLLLHQLKEKIESLDYDSPFPKKNFPVLWWDAFVDTAKKYRIPKAGFLNQIAGQIFDISFVSINTTADFLEYCRLVAGSVGLMLAPLLADFSTVDDPDSFLTACEHLGIGMQITNILRDIGEDIKIRNRIYLPQDKMKQYGISAEELKALTMEVESPAIPSLVIQLWEELEAMSTPYYEAFHKKISSFLPEARFPLIAAALSYHAIADAVRKKGYDCFHQRCYTSKWTRMQLIRKAKKLANTFGERE